MRNKRSRLLILLLVGCLGAWLFLLWWAKSYEAPPNYSLIEDGLYMGGDVAEPPPGTKAVISLCRGEDRYHSDMDFYLAKPIRDGEPGPDVVWLRRMAEYIDARRRAGVTTFVHCRNGVSRSGLVVTAYLMFEKHWTRDRALAFVRSKRPQVRPNPAFMERLLEWEQALKIPK